MRAESNLTLYLSQIRRKRASSLSIIISLFVIALGRNNLSCKSFINEESSALKI